MTARDKFIDQVEGYTTFLRKLGAEIQSLQIDPVASDDDIQRTEAQLGMELPPSLRRVFQTIASSVDFGWAHLAEHTENHDLYVPSGSVTWSLRRLSEAYKIAKKWARDDGSDWGRIWRGTLPVVEVACGDYIGIALSNGSDVVYLNHEAPDAHGHVIAPDFETFLYEWAALMFPGPDWAYWQPFVDVDTQLLSSRTQAAVDWPRWLAGELKS